MTKLRPTFCNQQVVVPIFLVDMRSLGEAIASAIPHIECLCGIASLHIDDLCLDRVTSVCNNDTAVIVEKDVGINDVRGFDSEWHRPSRVIRCVLGGEDIKGGRQGTQDVGGDKVESAVVVTKGGSKYTPSLDVVAGLKSRKLFWTIDHIAG